MKNIIGLVQDCKSGIPLTMLENKYKIPIHSIIKILFALTTDKGVSNVSNKN